jgi:hypothetical protein
MNPEAKSPCITAHKVCMIFSHAEVVHSLRFTSVGQTLDRYLAAVVANQIVPDTQFCCRNPASCNRIKGMLSSCPNRLATCVYCEDATVMVCEDGLYSHDTGRKVMGRIRPGKHKISFTKFFNCQRALKTSQQWALENQPL